MAHGYSYNASPADRGVLVSVVALILMLVPSGSAQAARDWASPTTLDRGSSSHLATPTPRVAIAGRNRVAATWVRKQVVIATVRRLRRPVEAQRIGRGLRPTVAVNRDGASIVVFEADRRLHVAFLARSARRYARPRPITARARGRIAEDAVVRVDGNGRFVIAYESIRQVRGERSQEIHAATFSATGRRVGSVQSLGLGGLVDRSFHALANGELVGLAVRPNLPAGTIPTLGGDQPQAASFLQLLRRSSQQTEFSATLIEVPSDFDDGQLNVDPDGTLALSGQRVTSSGDAGSSGYPVAAASLGQGFAQLAGPSVQNPNRNFGALALPTRGDDVSLLWQQKKAPSAFARAAPILAAPVRAGGRMVRRPSRVTRRAAREPQVVGLPGGRGVAVWDDDGRWGSAQQAADGSWTRTDAPRGEPVAFHDADTNRDLQASVSGEVAFVWQDRGGIRLSVRR